MDINSLSADYVLQIQTDQIAKSTNMTSGEKSDAYLEVIAEVYMAGQEQAILLGKRLVGTLVMATFLKADVPFDEFVSIVKRRVSDNRLVVDTEGETEARLLAAFDKAVLRLREQGVKVPGESYYKGLSGNQTSRPLGASAKVEARRPRQRHALIQVRR